MDDPFVAEPAKAELLPARSGESTLDAMNELRALTSVMEALRQITSDEARERILKAAALFFRVPLNSGRRDLGRDRSQDQLPAPTRAVSVPRADTRAGAAHLELQQIGRLRDGNPLRLGEGDGEVNAREIANNLQLAQGLNA